MALVAGCGGGGGVDGQIEALSAAFATDDGGDLDEEDATCVADELVAALDADAIGDVGGSAEDVLDADLDDLGLDPDDPDDAGDVFELYDDCDVDFDDVDADDLTGLAGEATETALLGAYGESLASMLGDEFVIGDELDGGALDCAGSALGRQAGVEALADFGEPSEVEEAEGLFELRLEIDDDEELRDALTDCDVDLLAIGEGALDESGFIDDEGFDCLTSELGDENIERVGTFAFVAGADEAVFVDDDLADLVFDASDTCFEELDVEDEEDEPPAFPDADYVASLTGALVSDPVPVEPTLAACVAQTWSDLLGPAFFSEILVIEPDELAVLDDLANASFLSVDADLLVEAADTCGAPLPALLLSMLDTAPLSPDQIACFVGALTDPLVPVDAIDAVLTDGTLPPADDPAGVAVVDAITNCGIAG
jgi:hypothetical protein